MKQLVSNVGAPPPSAQAQLATINVQLLGNPSRAATMILPRDLTALEAMALHRAIGDVFEKLQQGPDLHVPKPGAPLPERPI